jgi:hypothetical protein
MGFSCSKSDIDNVVVADYIYVNLTSYSITCQAYKMGHDSVFSIVAGSVLKISEDLFVGTNNKIVDADSVKITFDSSKSIYFYPETSSSRNVIKLENYEHTLLSKRHHEYRFSFSESDFD